MEFSFSQLLPAEFTFSQLLLAFAVLVVIDLIAVELWRFYKKKKLQKLEQQFAAEHTRIVNDLDSQATTRLNLVVSGVPVKHFNIVPLNAAEAARFGYAWNALQDRFDANPKGAVVEADHLVRELMMQLGYPVSNFEERADEISVDHPGVVTNFRAAQAIAVRDVHGHADTEARRKALVYYRALFDELLDVPHAKPEQIQAELLAVQY
jgi:hypothetical protein